MKASKTWKLKSFLTKFTQIFFYLHFFYQSFENSIPLKCQKMEDHNHVIRASSILLSFLDRSWLIYKPLWKLWRKISPFLYLFKSIWINANFATVDNNKCCSTWRKYILEHIHVPSSMVVYNKSHLNIFFLITHYYNVCYITWAWLDKTCRCFSLSIKAIHQNKRDGSIPVI